MMVTEATVKQLQKKSITTQEQIFAAMVEILFDLAADADHIGDMFGNIENEIRELRTEIRSMNRRGN